MYANTELLKMIFINLLDKETSDYLLEASRDGTFTILLVRGNIMPLSLAMKIQKDYSTKKLSLGCRTLYFLIFLQGVIKGHKLSEFYL